MKVRRGSKRNEFSGQLCRSIIGKQQLSGSISVGLEFVIWDHEVAGSSPVFPTIKPS